MGPVQYTGFMVLTDELRGSIPLQATNIRRVGALVRAVRRPLRTALTFVFASIAQLVERLVSNQKVVSSIPITRSMVW